MTTINIGTSKKNLTNIKIDKPYNEITFQDIVKIVSETFPDTKGVNIYGWSDVAYIRKTHSPSLDAISQEINSFSFRTCEGGETLNPDDAQYYAALELCYDLLSRTNTVMAMQVEMPEEMKEPGIGDDDVDMVHRYGISTNLFADNVIEQISGGKPHMDLRMKVIQLMQKHHCSQRYLSDQTGVRRSAINMFVAGKSNLRSDMLDKIFEYFDKIR